MKNKWILILSCSFMLFALSGCNQAEEVLDKVIKLLDQELEDNNDSVAANNENDDVTNEEPENNEKGSSTESSQETNDEDDKDDEAENNTDNSADDIQGEHEDSMLSLRGELRESGETEVDHLSIPNGLPLYLPEDWVLIEELQTEPWEGILCFEKNELEWHTEDDDYEDGVDDPHTFHTNMYETIDEIEAKYESLGYDVTGNNIMDNSLNVHNTNYKFEQGGVTWTGDLVYFFHDVGDNNFSCARVTVYME